MRRVLHRLTRAALGAGAVAAAFGLAAGAQAQDLYGTLAKIDAANEIVIGHRETSIPFSWIDSAGGPAQGFPVDRKQVQIDIRIKTLGLFQVRVVLHPEVICTVNVNVARSQDEAEMQEQRGGMITAEEAAEEAIAEEVPVEAAAEGLIQPVEETGTSGVGTEEASEEEAR